MRKQSRFRLPGIAEEWEEVINELKKMGSEQAKKILRRLNLEASTENQLDLRTNHKLINGPEDFLNHYEIDTKQWDLHHWGTKAWEAVVKDGPDNNKVVPLRQFDARLKRIDQADTYLRFKEDLTNLLNSATLKPKTFKQKKIDTDEKYTLELFFTDLHLGKIARDGNHDEIWNLDIAEETVISCLQEMVETRISDSIFDRIEKVIFVVGSDYLHFDNMHKETTKGTKMDSSYTYSHLFLRACKLAYACIDYLQERFSNAIIDVPLIPGNHDYNSIITMGEVLVQRYKGNHQVIIDPVCNSMNFTKYRLIGNNLVGWNHGNLFKPEKLATLPAIQVPDLWAKSANGVRELHIGHLHHKNSKSTWTKTSKDIYEKSGVTVMMVGALCPPDEFHERFAYIGSQEETICFLWSNKRGIISTNRLKVV